MSGLIDLAGLDDAALAAITAGGGLTRTAVKTGAYTASAGDLVPVDTTAGNVTVTLPAAPADKAKVTVKHIIQGGTNTVTVACGGSDVLNKAGGSTSAALALVNEGATYEYQASTHVWTVTAGDLPLSGLNGTYAQVVGLTGSGIDLAGSTDSTTAVNALLAANPGKRIRAVPGATYKISAPLVVQSGQEVDLTGSRWTLASGSNCNILQNAAVTPTATAADGAITSGSATLTTGLGAQAVAGQTVTVAAAGANGNAPLTANVVSATSTTITLSVTAQATVASAVVKLFTRDAKIRVVGGTFNRGGNVGSGTGLHSLLFRHVDGLTLDPQAITSSAGKYAISIASCTQVWARARNLATASDGVHLMGPLDGVRIEEIAGTTGDDCFAITACDWAAYADTCGDVTSVSVGNISASSTGARCAIVVAGAGMLVDKVKVDGMLTGSCGTHCVRIGEDTSQAGTTGGTYGLIDLGLIATTGPASSAQLFISGTVASRVKARLRTRQTSNLVRSVYANGAASAATIGLLELEIDGDCASNAGYLAAIEINSANQTVTQLQVSRARFVGPTAQATPLVQVSNGTVTETILNDIRVDYASATGYLVRHIGGTLSRLVFGSGTVSAGNVAFRKDSTGTGNTLVTMSGGFTVTGCSRVADCRVGTVTFRLNGPYFDTITNAAFFTNAATLILDGSATTNGSFTLIQRAASESVRVMTPRLPVDGSVLTPTAGDMVYNTNTSWASGTGTDKSGVYGYTGSAWTKVYGPA